MRIVVPMGNHIPTNVEIHAIVHMANEFPQLQPLVVMLDDIYATGGDSKYYHSAVRTLALLLPRWTMNKNGKMTKE